MDLRAILMGLGFAVMWSSAFVSARVIVTYAPPLSALSLRFAISGLLAVGVARALGQSWWLERAQWRAVLVLGLCQNAIYLGLNFVAMQSVEASVAAIIASTMPLLVALVSWGALGERIAPAGIAGLVAGFAGVAIIMAGRIGGDAPVMGLALCGISVVSLTVATLLVQGASSRGNVLMIVGLQMLVGWAMLTPLALAVETATVQWSWQLIVAFAYTVIFPGVIATLTWFLLVGRIGAVKAATFHFLNPFLGVAIAWALLGERLGALDVVGVMVIAAGILAVQLTRQGRV